MINQYLKLIKDLFLLKNQNNQENLKKLCAIVGFCNVTTCMFFYFWLFIFVNTSNSSNITSTNFLLLFICSHIYLNIVLINWSLKYENTKFSIWIWLSLLFITPLGLKLIFMSNNPDNWTEIKQKNTKNSIFHSFINSFIDLPKNLNAAISFLNKNFSEDFQNFLNYQNLSIKNQENWKNYDKFLIIALHEALRQTKKINKFSDVIFKAHWYDDRYFDFALPDPKSKLMPVRYKYSLAFIVLDEFNNYAKILRNKKEIKSNLKFGTAKTICLHWGKGFKIYINE